MSDADGVDAKAYSAYSAYCLNLRIHESMHRQVKTTVFPTLPDQPNRRSYAVVQYTNRNYSSLIIKLKFLDVSMKQSLTWNVVKSFIRLTQELYKII